MSKSTKNICFDDICWSLISAELPTFQYNTNTFQLRWYCTQNMCYEQFVLIATYASVPPAFGQSRFLITEHVLFCA
ncbi:unnamed protein product [Callosobruchus maculatus]|uniref:Uncharacterized protein n=1 Tax=Callosobruchus maculatus TaxID=64391 RepID=A0A653C4L8_CALMS|nr:unnamed protein product [Callosobruchus maculatus]